MRYIYNLKLKLKITLLITFLPWYLITLKSHADNIKNSVNNEETNFKRLPEVKDLEKQNNTGKIDIFSFGGANTNLLLSLKLLGVFKSKNISYAIINYNNKIGEVTIGNKGGKDTIYLPNDYELVNINLEKFSVIVKSKEKFYEIKGL